MLRMGTRYALRVLRDEAQDRLEKFFPLSFTEIGLSVLDRFDCDDKCNVEGKTPPLILMTEKETVEVIRLAQQYNVASLLPTAFYMLTTMDVNDLIAAVKARDLSTEDLSRVLRGAEELRKARVRALRPLLIQETGPKCQTGSACGKICGEAVIQLMDAESMWTSVALSRDTSWLEIYITDICSSCRKHILKTYKAAQKDTWRSLGNYFDVGPRPPPSS